MPWPNTLAVRQANRMPAQMLRIASTASMAIVDGCALQSNAASSASLMVLRSAVPSNAMIIPAAQLVKKSAQNQFFMPTILYIIYTL